MKLIKEHDIVIAGTDVHYIEVSVDHGGEINYMHSYVDGERAEFSIYVSDQWKHTIYEICTREEAVRRYKQLNKSTKDLTFVEFYVHEDGLFVYFLLRGYHKSWELTKHDGSQYFPSKLKRDKVPANFEILTQSGCGDYVEVKHKIYKEIKWVEIAACNNEGMPTAFFDASPHFIPKSEQTKT